MDNAILNFYNGFGITPTNTHISAGTDYYIPNIDSLDADKLKIVEEAFIKSFNITKEELENIMVMFCEVFSTLRKTNKNIPPSKKIAKNIHNILHLYFALQSYELENIRIANGDINGHFIEDIYYFVENYLRFDNKYTPGICANLNDHLFINSGIKIALNKNDAGLYVNKSGMGNKGWDVRACLVDEDYSGYVHLSCAFTKNTHNEKSRTIFCGDKITQMIIITVKHYIYNEIDNKTYNELMKNSERGSDGFGSSDVKH